MAGLIAILFFMALIFIVPICIIVIVVKMIRAPKPPAGMNSSEFYWWYFQDGWKITQREEELRRQIEENHKQMRELIKEYLRSGDKMEAIQTYKDFFECGINEAKLAISELEWEIEYEEYKRSRDEDLSP